jgi:hypothetical protein
MIEYKKLLHYIMMYKSALDTRDNKNMPLAETFLKRCDDMILNDYFTDDELKELIKLQLKYNIVVNQSLGCRDIIDHIFRVMGIYKEPTYVVE